VAVVAAQTEVIGVDILLLTGVRAGEPASVLPALELLPHAVRTAPRDVRTLVAGPSPDIVLVDARTELVDARSTCRMLHATGLGVPLLVVVNESGLVALSADWGVDDVVLASAGPAEIEARNPNNVGGDIAGGRCDRLRLMFRPTAAPVPYATPNRAIYLCSAATPPGPGVHGMCGYHAARVALRRVFRTAMADRTAEARG
jgi:hypothetical protein